MSYQAIKFQREGSIARITLARPDAANALNFAMGEELYKVAKICAARLRLKAMSAKSPRVALAACLKRPELPPKCR